MSIYNPHTTASFSKLLSLTIALWLACQSNAFASDLDSSIIKEALNGTVCRRNINVIIEGAYFQSTKFNKKERKPERHFEDENLDRSFKYISSERTKVLNSALEAGPDPEMRTRALFHFGMMIHTLNSFYRNTDYLPKKIKQLNRTTSGAFNPYEIDLVDWSKPKENKLELLNKSSRQKILEKKVQSTTVNRVARGLAIREVRRQWDFLESLIRNKYVDKADTIIAALKSAGCDSLVPEELGHIPLHAQEL